MISPTLHSDSKSCLKSGEFIFALKKGEQEEKTESKDTPEDVGF